MAHVTRSDDPELTAKIVDIARLDLGPNEFLWVKVDGNPEVASEVRRALSAYIPDLPPERVIVASDMLTPCVVRFPRPEPASVGANGPGPYDQDTQSVDQVV